MKLSIFSSAAQRFASVGIGILSTLLMTNFMMAEQYGYYVYVLGVVTLILVPAQIGLPQLILRETVRSVEAGDEIATASIIRWGYVGVTVAGFIAIGGLVVFASTGMASNISHLILLALPLVLLTSWNAVRASVLRAYGWVTRSQLPENIAKPGALLLGVAALIAVTHGNLTAEQAVGANVFAVAMAFVVGFFLFRKAHSGGGKVRGVYRHKAWLLATFALSITTALRAVSMNLNVVLLGNFGMIEEAGVFKVASLIGGQVGIALQVANIVLAKDVGAALQREDKGEAERLLRKSSFLTTLTSGAVVICLAIIGRPLLSFAFPPAFSDAYWPMLILAFAQFVNCMTGSVALLLNLARLEWDITGALVISTGLNVILNVLLIPRFGIEGAAASSLISMTVWNVLLHVRAGRKLQVNVGFLAGAADFIQSLKARKT